MRTFRDYSPEERRNFITLSTGEYYPDILEDACRLYSPVLEMFSQLLNRSESSSALFMNIADPVDENSAMQSLQKICISRDTC